MRINKEEARLLVTFIADNYEDYIAHLHEDEEHGRIPKGTAKAVLAGIAAICETMGDYGEDKRGNGRWNPNTDDMSLKELGVRVYNRRAENLRGNERKYRIYYDLERMTLAKS